jgi:hypothetical protein
MKTPVTVTENTMGAQIFFLMRNLVRAGFPSIAIILNDSANTGRDMDVALREAAAGLEIRAQRYPAQHANMARIFIERINQLREFSIEPIAVAGMELEWVGRHAWDAEEAEGDA